MKDFDCINNMDKTPKFKWQKKRMKFWKFHLYRMPWALSANVMDDLLERYDKDTEYKFEGSVTWSEWRKRIKKICPFQYWFREDFCHWVHYRFVFHPRHTWYDIKDYFRPWNVLKIKSLPRSWTDESHLLVHAIFAVLERYMESNPWGTHDYDLKEKDPGMQLTDEEHEKYAEPYRQHKRDITEAWAWWQKRDERQKMLDDAYDMAHKRRKQKLPYDQTYKEVIELEARFGKEEDEMIQKILKHRGGLWN